MAENKRLGQLLEKELDGAISAVERDELERLIRVEPVRRKEREAWRRVAATIAEQPAPRIELSRMTARVLSGRTRSLRVGSFRGFGPFRALLAASTLAAIAVVFVASRPAPVQVEKPAVARIVKPPVDVFVDESTADDDRSALVEIRF